MTTTVYNTPGVYTFVVPPQCTTITIDIIGAGGPFSTDGVGGRVAGTKTVTPGDTLKIYVGGVGSAPGGGSSGAGGFNGGGAGGTTTGGSGATDGYGGSGASDIRVSPYGLANRFVVAGGAGATGRGNAGHAKGGSGNGPTGVLGVDGTGANGGHGGSGGGAGAGGAGGTGGSAADGLPGVLGIGGASADTSTAGRQSGGGGGGGYYGGGGGEAGASTSDEGGGGGGGSNYAGGMTTVTANAAGGLGAQLPGSVSITYNLAPNQPTISAAADFDVALAKSIAFPFSDDDPGDSLSSADIRWRIGSGAWTTTNVLAGALSIVTGWFGTTVTYSFAPSYFASYVNQSVEVQVRTRDAAGATSAYSPSVFIVPRTAPPAPVISSPAAGSLIRSKTPSVTWTTGSPMSGSYEIGVYDAAGTTLLAISSDIPGSGASGASSTAPFYNYVNGTDYQIGVRYSAPSGVWSAWTLTGAMTAGVNAPLQPTLVLTPVSETASVRIDITNPGSDPYPPLYNDVFRTDLDGDNIEVKIATGIAVNGSFTDFTPGSRSTYRYRVEAVNATSLVSSG